METNSLSERNAVYSHIEEAYCKVVYTYTTHIVQAAKIHRRNNFLKWAQIILSAISAVGFIGNVITNQNALIWIGGICSCTLLVLSAYFKEHDLSSVYKEHLTTSNRLWLIREKYLALLADYDSLTADEIRKKRDSLTKETAEIYEAAPITDSSSYSKAQTMLKEQESQSFTREELNKMLPESLRR